MKSVFLFLILFFPVTAFADDLAAKAPVLMIHGDDYFETAEFQKLSTTDKIKEIFPSVGYVYSEYINDLFPDSKDLYLQYKLRALCLKTPDHINDRNLRLINQAQIQAPVFIAAYRNAVEWAKQEKLKSPQELYDLVHMDTQELLPEIRVAKSGLQNSYLELAAAKGHDIAQKEAKENEEELKKFIACESKSSSYVEELQKQKRDQDALIEILKCLQE